MAPTHLRPEQDVDSAIVAWATELLASRWCLPAPVSRVALSDLAEDLGVEVLDLAGLVVRSSFMPRRRQA